jgi:hypothetical protein
VGVVRDDDECDENGEHPEQAENGYKELPGCDHEVSSAITVVEPGGATSDVSRNLSL